MQKIKKGDTVQIMLGKDHGKTGTIERILVKDKRALILGLNAYKRHIKKQGDIEGGIMDLSKSIQISNLNVVCPTCKKVTRVGFKIEGKEKFRVCKKCGKEIKFKQ
ncbi:MAG: 50S ribosomal protein L24 [Candidatus Daviesbacteria bacterium]|nr:50S ribosomal protein L24 [Candidatus Daviesbacteria bacterium]